TTRIILKNGAEFCAAFRPEAHPAVLVKGRLADQPIRSIRKLNCQGWSEVHRLEFRFHLALERHGIGGAGLIFAFVILGVRLEPDNRICRELPGGRFAGDSARARAWNTIPKTDPIIE